MLRHSFVFFCPLLRTRILLFVCQRTVAEISHPQLTDIPRASSFERLFIGKLISISCVCCVVNNVVVSYANDLFLFSTDNNDDDYNCIHAD